MTKINDCPRCHKEKSITHPQFGKMQGKKCRDKDRKLVGEITTPPEFATGSQADRIQEDRLKHEKDILQPFNMDNTPNQDFIRSYPERAKDFFTQEQLEKL